LSGNTFTNILSSFTFLSSDERIRAVGEAKFQIAPDGSVRGFLLVARGHRFDLTVSRSSLDRGLRCLLVECSSHGTIEASFYSGDFLFSILGSGSLKQGSRANMELKEISLSLRIKGDSHHLSSSRDNFGCGVPLLGVVRSNSAENFSPSGVGESESESTRNRLTDFTLIGGLIHPHFCDVTINLFSSH
jgi:hypothetical protein